MSEGRKTQVMLLDDRRLEILIQVIIIEFQFISSFYISFDIGNAFDILTRTHFCRMPIARLPTYVTYTTENITLPQLRWRTLII